MGMIPSTTDTQRIAALESVSRMLTSSESRDGAHHHVRDKLDLASAGAGSQLAGTTESASVLENEIALVSATPDSKAEAAPMGNGALQEIVVESRRGRGTYWWGSPSS
jgi:hypothetical protein